MTKTCNCIQQTNEALKPMGVKLVTAIQFVRETHAMEVILPIATEKIDPHDRKIKPITLLASFCPFCGAVIKPMTPTIESGGATP